ncbi:hypothetical protein GUJ93_ZPchr0004g40533 [Zizania palustris]|uniref:Pentatricopeptide repeat-containing protein n=1 Tax=Zizania palustris TaxID=103762 RepID=A0A8J5VZZ3_ZIZPA|nr:hypothetical protein GUJ93_ZPchr0004g40533 [Zizania palustris]
MLLLCSCDMLSVSPSPPAFDIVGKHFEFPLATSLLVSHYNPHALADALCDHRRVDKAHQYHLCFGKDPPPFPPVTKTHNLLRSDMDHRGVAKDLHSYSIYMDVLAKSGKPWKAFKVFGEMKQKGLPIDVVAYNTAIHSIGLAQGVDFAIRLYKQ